MRVGLVSLITAHTQNTSLWLHFVISACTRAVRLPALITSHQRLIPLLQYLEERTEAATKFSDELQYRWLA